MLPLSVARLLVITFSNKCSSLETIFFFFFKFVNTYAQRAFELEATFIAIILSKFTRENFSSLNLDLS